MKQTSILIISNSQQEMLKIHVSSCSPEADFEHSVNKKL